MGGFSKYLLIAPAVVVAGIVLLGACLGIAVFSAATSSVSACQQGQGVSTFGSSLPVSRAAGLNASQQTFVAVFATDTGMDAAVVAAWALAEEGGQSVAPNGPANWLNIGSTDSVFLGGTNPAWQDPTSAANASAAWLKGTPAPGFGTASAGVQAILQTAGQSPAAQIVAIQTSGWASSGYPDLPSLYQQVTGSRFVVLPVTTPTASLQCSISTATPGVLTSGQRARIQPNGMASIPASAPIAVQHAIAAANQIINTPYPAPDVHYGPLSTRWPAYDCSGSTSYVLFGAGLMSSTAKVSGDFMTWGVKGPGAWITIYSNPEHVFMVIAGLAFDTAHYGPTIPAGTGPRWLGNQLGNLRDGLGYTVTHPPGL